MDQSGMKKEGTSEDFEVNVPIYRPSRSKKERAHKGRELKDVKIGTRGEIFTPPKHEELKPAYMRVAQIDGLTALVGVMWCDTELPLSIQDLFSHMRDVKGGNIREKIGTTVPVSLRVYYTRRKREGSRLSLRRKKDQKKIWDVHHVHVMPAGTTEYDESARFVIGERSRVSPRVDHEGNLLMFQNRSGTKLHLAIPTPEGFKAFPDKFMFLNIEHGRLISLLQKAFPPEATPKLEDIPHKRFKEPVLPFSRRRRR